MPQEDADVVVIGLGANDGQDVKVDGESYRANLAILRTATKNAFDAVPASGADAVYLDVWDLFLGLDGNYSQFVIDPSDGERKKSRGGDGFHLSLVGNKILAAAITAEVDEAFERQAAQ